MRRIDFNRRGLLSLSVIFSALLAATCTAGPSVTPGQLIADNPTIENLSFRWLIEGDDNNNAAVTVEYRQEGQKAWRPALSMRRVHDETSGAKAFPVTAGNLFAGSVLDLKPDTAYEVRLALTDPDGGGETRTVRARTRPEPTQYGGLRQLHVYPAFAPPGGPAAGFADLAAAFAQAQPGDVVLLHAGTYRGPFRIAAGGKAGAPLVFRSAGDGGVILDGGGNAEDSVVELDEGRDFVRLEGLTVRSGRCGIRGTDTRGLVVRRCTITNVDYGVTTGTPAPGQLKCADWYVADNDLTGRYPLPLKPSQEHFGAGINIAGRGHVACYNRVRQFWDGISTAHTKNGSMQGWDSAAEGPQHAIDIYNNEIRDTVDDAIEADYIACNIRVMRNYVVGSAAAGISAQPCLAGPLYCVRNVLINVNMHPWKFFQQSVGAELYHNTVVTATGHPFNYIGALAKNLRSRNNVFLSLAEFRPAFPITHRGDSYDYDAFAAVPIWSADGKDWHYECKSLQEFAMASGQEAHGVIVDRNCFRCLPAPSPGPKGFFDASALDLSPAEGGLLIDAGEVLPNVSDGFTGRAPDIGAYEAGRNPPHYGPRTAKQ